MECCKASSPTGKKLQEKASVLALSLLLSIRSLVGYSHSPNDKSINALLMAVIGFFLLVELLI